MIYFWNSKALIGDISKDKLTEKEWFFYFLALPVFAAMRNLLKIPPGEVYNNSALEILSMLTVELTGLILCFRTNRRIDNTDFIARFIAFSVCNFFKIIICSALPTIFVFGVGYGYTRYIGDGFIKPSNFIHQGLDVYFAISMDLIWFFLVYRNFKQLEALKAHLTSTFMAI